MKNVTTNFFAERDYPSELLNAARGMIITGRYEISGVTAQMACEVFTERTIRAYFRTRSVEFLEKSVEDLLPSYNLSNDKVRGIYVALTQDSIHRQYFWAEYKTMVSIRNKAVHAGARVQESQAQMVVRIATSIIKHLQAIECKAFGLTSDSQAK